METNGDFIEVATVQSLWKVRARGCDAPKNLRLEVGVGHDVLKASVDSVEVVTRKCIV
jgi:hypothetical protein